MQNRTSFKDAAGRAAASYVEDGMRVGLGTGSTVRFTILELGRRHLDIVCVATSLASEELAASVGLRVVPPGAVDGLDIAVDGADEVDTELNLVKGGGGAHAREKIVATMAERFVVVVDESKLVDRLGRFGLPIEVLEFGSVVVGRQLRALGATEVTRQSVLSENGNPLLHADFGLVEDPPALAAAVAAVPGVIEHGIFLAGLVERVVVAGSDGVSEIGRA